MMSTGSSQSSEMSLGKRKKTTCRKSSKKKLVRPFERSRAEPRREQPENAASRTPCPEAAPKKGGGTCTTTAEPTSSFHARGHHVADWLHRLRERTGSGLHDWAIRW